MAVEPKACGVCGYFNCDCAAQRRVKELRERVLEGNGRADLRSVDSLLLEVSEYRNACVFSLGILRRGLGGDRGVLERAVRDAMDLLENVVPREVV